MKKFVVNVMAILSVLLLQGCLFDGSPVSDTVYTVGGTVSGLDGGAVVLQSNGKDDLSLTDNGIFTFASTLASGAAYSVTVSAQPEGRQCSVEHGSGLITDSNITDIHIVCEAVQIETYSVGGSVSGLDGSITLQNNGANDVTLTADGSFSFPAQNDSTAYAVIITSAPTTQTCIVANGSGTLSGANITNVHVTCTTNTYSVGGSVSGLNGTVVLQNNSGDDLSLTSNGGFTFGTALADGSAYSVMVKTQPTGQTCSINNHSGTISGADVGNVEVNCITNTYSVGGSVSGLESDESVVLQNNGGDDITLEGEVDFTFATLLAHGATYRVTVRTNPSIKTCSINNAEGTIDSSNVTDVEVICSIPSGDLHAHIGNLGEGKQLELNVTISKDAATETNSITLTGTVPSGVERFMLEDAIEAGSDYNISITVHPEDRVCTPSTLNGTVTSIHLHPVMEISCKNAPQPSTRPFVITIKPEMHNGKYIYAFIKRSSLPYLYDIDCDSDGINEGEGVTTNFTCTYENTEEKNISVLGIFPSIQGGYHDCSNMHHILSVEQWGDQQWLTMESAFLGCRDVVFHATDRPDLSQVTSMRGMFEQADHFNSPINDWNVSHVVNMGSMFARAKDFNQSLNHWDVSSVTDMHNMFNQTEHFDQPLNDWNVSKVINMSSMFGTAPNFNQPLNHWDVYQVINMNAMFENAISFNQPLNDWNVSRVVYMRSMFHRSIAFNQMLNHWDVSSVNDMVYMFLNATDFNQSLNDWNVSSVTNMRGMFEGAANFDQPLNDWNVSSVTDMRNMFREASSFDQNISNWDVSSDPMHTNFAQNCPIEGTTKEPDWP